MAVVVASLDCALLALDVVLAEELEDEELEASAARLGSETKEAETVESVHSDGREPLPATKFTEAHLYRMESVLHRTLKDWKHGART